MMPDSAKPVPAVDNALKLLKSMASAGGDHGVASLARATGITPSSTFNILKTLARQGIVSFDPGTKTYRIGMGVLEIVTPVLGANPNDLIRPLLQEMADEFRVLVTLWQITAHERVILSDRVMPPRIVHASVGAQSRLPVWSGAVGRCYGALAGKSEAEIRAGYAGVRWQCEPGITRFLEEVEVARSLGYAFDFGNLFIGLNIAAAIVRDREGAPRFSLSTISIEGQTSRAVLGEVATRLRSAADSIERNIFGRQPTPAPHAGTDRGE